LAQQKGRFLLIQVESAPGTGTFLNVGGLQTKSVKVNNEMVDVTNSDSNGWRKLLEGAGVNSIEASGSGVFSDDQAIDIVRDAAEQNLHLNFKVICPGDTYKRVYTGRWGVANFEYSGEFKDAAKFSATFQSDGQQTITRV
jgi:TP901-1 family phage major tail protein